MNVIEHKEKLQKALEESAFVRTNEMRIAKRGGQEKEKGWLFDIRNILLEPNIVEHVAALFWNEFSAFEDLQIGGMETAGIPLVTALVLSGASHQKKVAGFYIRKSRKKDGLMKIIEGQLRPGVPIVLVDDLTNSGKSILKQIGILKELGHDVKDIWVMIRFRDLGYYEYLKEQGVRIHWIFTLDDFQKTLGIQNFKSKELRMPLLTYTPLWKFASGNPSHNYVVPKSDPVIDEERVYFGSDDGIFWALDQKTGNVIWSYKVGFHPKGKGIFSSPVVHNNTLYFGAYDGNVYALNAQDGKKKWIFFGADWVGSSPALSVEDNLLFVGMEFGLWKKRGGIAALDLTTGKPVWQYTQMPGYTHSSPLFIREHGQVVIGNNDGGAYLFNGTRGDLIWKFATGTPTEEELASGFSEHDIKESFAYDTKRDLLIFGNRNASVFFVRRKDGTLVSRFSAEFGFYSTPVIYKDTVLVSSLDKNLYCIDLKSFDEKWKWHAGARIFATPVIINEHIYIGANTGRLTELDPDTGEETSFFQTTERITNKTAYNPKNKRYFIPTCANEIYCIEKSEGKIL